MEPITLLLCGDVMTGRGIDQILPHPSDPELGEPWVRDARDYRTLAEAAHGAIPGGVPASYVWGDALDELERVRPDARIVNLETAVTCSDERAPKGINYRMHPDNVGCLAVAGIDCCALANNHVLDWGRRGLVDTLDTLHRAGIATAGAGRDRCGAEACAAIPLPDGRRVLVAAMGTRSSGIPGHWAATETEPGVALLEDLSTGSADRVARIVGSARRPGDLVVASIHWGANWGYAIEGAARRFAHRLIEEAGVDVVHGHSSHHPKAIEVHAGRLVCYGCGDLVNDYEGIHGHEEFRGELGLMYFPAFTGGGALLRLELVATRMRRFRLERAPPADAHWIAGVLDRESRGFGTRVRCDDDGRIDATWAAH